MTPEQMRDEFLQAVADVARYWLAEDRAPTTLAKMNGMVFSLLVILDGGSLDVPGMQVIPKCDEGGRSRRDIAGTLHENWHRFEPKEGAR